MIRQRVSLAVAGAVVASTALTMGLSTPASAAPTIYDPTFTPGAGDLTGVGSDTSEIALDFLSKGNAGIAGFNADKVTGRIGSFAALGDPTSIVLKSGSAAVTRPNGSGAGKLTLFGTGNNPDVDFARSSSALNTAETAALLQQAPFAVDGLKLAVATTSNAPATITPADMVKIYNGTFTNWSQLGGAPGVIKPLIPQTGSGTRSFFVAQLQAANGGVAVPLGGAVTDTQEHSDADIKNNPNAVAPFSTGRARPLTATIKVVDGFSAKRALYNVVRQADLSGPKATLIQSAFSATGFLCSAAAKPLIEAAGFDQLATPVNGGVCGTFGQTAASNLQTNAPAQVTTTSLSGVTQNDKSVKLTAAVTAADGSTAGGTVSFFETVGGSKVAVSTPKTVIGGSATLTIANVALGDHVYSASYTPTSNLTYVASSSSDSTVKVLKTSAISVGSVSKTFGAAASIPVSVTGDGAPAGGSVTVNIGGSVSTVGLSSGSASIPVPTALGTGSYAVSVSYNSDGVTSASAANGSLSISKVGTASSIKLSKKTIRASKKAKVTITVKAPGSSILATGKVTVKAGKKIVGTGTVKNGKVTLNLKKLKKGSYKLKATFAGNANFGASTTKSITLKVTK